MKTKLTIAMLTLAISACGSGGGSTGGNPVESGGASGGTSGGSGGTGGTKSDGGTKASGGSTMTGGQTGGTPRDTGGSQGGNGGGPAGGQAGRGTGGTASGGTASGGTASGGTASGGTASGGTASGGTGSGGINGGATGGGGEGGGAGGQGGSTVVNSCVPTKTFGTFDPSKPGPFEVVVEKDVGPAAGVADKLHNNEVPHFNVYRPKDLTQGFCHPVITWGNGTGDQPEPNPPLCLAANYCGSYKLLVNQLASHGFVVVASLSSQTAQGTPLPQVAGVDWMIKENETPTSAYYHHLDVSHIGATGHSQGGMATTLSGADPRITATTPICGSNATVTLHGPALLICGGADTVVPCNTRVQPAFDAIKTTPAMMVEVAGMTHGSWIGSIQDPVMVGTTAWMRVHLMNDTANRAMFYGASCKWCTDSKLKVQRKMMDQ